jgi:adenylosuccinate lyase
VNSPESQGQTTPADAPDRWSAYESPLATRNASPEMQSVWSPRRKFETWRRLWVALAEAERDLGLPVTDEQVEALRASVVMTEDDFARAAEHERRFRHDVMAHVHALGERAHDARPIIHLGATSQFVNDNAETLLLHEALGLVAAKTARAIDALASFAETWADTPALAFTHYQPAQPTTVGKRAASWAQDLALCLERLERTRSELRLRGVKGATGTQASFLALFEGDAEKVERLDERVCAAIALAAAQSDPGAETLADRRLLITGQTYPRITDAFVLGELAATAAAIHKICNDVRLLSNRKELDEPVAAAQIGSSAMPYKQNPMRCERATGLCRFVISLHANALNTAATQWLERTLDDSANRRLSLPESFLALDAALDLLANVASGLVVHEATTNANLMAELPFLASENLMMEAVRLGRDRQEVHEAIRRHSRDAGRAVKDEGRPNDLIERLRAEPLLEGVDLDAAMDPARYVGLAPRQTRRFIAEVVEPIRRRYAGRLAPAREPGV